MFASLLVAWLALPARGAFDYQWTFGDNGGFDYILTSASATVVYSGSLPAPDPTLNLIVSKRYRVTVLDYLGHPLEILSKAGNFTSDVVLLSMSGAGSLESDTGINWTELGGGVVEFTVTRTLVNAMRASGRIPGYRCVVHPDAMRGNFDVYGAGDPIADPLPDIVKGTLTIGLETIAEGLPAPLGVVDPRDGSNRLLVYDQSGLVVVVEDGVVLPTPLLDVAGRLVTLGILGSFDENDYDERGLLGLAVHPQFLTTRRLYTYTSEPVAAPADFTVSTWDGLFNHQSVVAEWTMDPANYNRVLPSSRREILRIDQPQFNHNGGDLHFGPDGYLYISLGDGGNADDQGSGHGPQGNGQNTANVLGTVMRIDVDGTNSLNGRYGIPADNPFVGRDGVDEIFAYGFRNPFRISFDAVSGALYVADVGQNDIEEINTVMAGGNYGWRHREGGFWFDPRGTLSGTVVTEPQLPPPPEPLLDPIAQYDHDDGLAVVGGFVYYGQGLPALRGRYVFGDFSRQFTAPLGRLFYLDAANQVREFRIRPTDAPLGLFLKGMGQDRNGDVYVCASRFLGPYGTGGIVLKIVPVTRASARPVWTEYR